MSGKDSTLDLAVMRFPLAEYCATLGAERGGSYELLLQCPACRKSKLSVSTRTRQWHCFICEHTVPEARGGVVKLVAWMEQKTIGEAIQRVIELASSSTSGTGEIAAEGYSFRELPSDRWPSGLPFDCGIVPITGVLPYMERRHISLEDARMFGLYYATTSWLANRIVFPVWSGGQALYWQARACWDEKEHVPTLRKDGSMSKFIKTLNPPMLQCALHGRFPEGNVRCPMCNRGPLFGKSDVVLNLELAAWCYHNRGERPCIIEGPTSCIRFGRNALGTFGKVLHEQQIALMVRAGFRAMDIMYDGPTPKEPKGAFEEAKRAGLALSPYIPDVRIIALPNGDPGDWPREQLHNFRNTPGSSAPPNAMHIP